MTRNFTCRRPLLFSVSSHPVGKSPVDDRGAVGGINFNVFTDGCERELLEDAHEHEDGQNGYGDGIDLSTSTLFLDAADILTARVHKQSKNDDLKLFCQVI